MLKEIEGNVWDLAMPDDYICILTNGSVIKGKNPMGGGIAREAVDRNPNIDIESLVANRIKSNLNLICIDEQSKAWMYRFETKKEIWVPSDLDTIEKNLIDLNYYASLLPRHKFFLPRPGCGFGGLDWETQVKPLCEKIINVRNIYIVSK